MVDKFHREIEENQLASQINHKAPSILIIKGGFTPGGQVRVVNVTNGGRKQTVKPEHLVILENSQAIGISEGIIEKTHEKIEAINNKMLTEELYNEHIESCLRAISNHEHNIQNMNTFIEIVRANPRNPGGGISFKPR